MADGFSVTDARKLTSIYQAASESTTRKLSAMAFNKIRLFATMGQSFTLWTIPPLTPDAPFYDRAQMTESIAAILRQAGYAVTVFAVDFLLLVTWFHRK